MPRTLFNALYTLLCIERLLMALKRFQALGIRDGFDPKEAAEVGEPVVGALCPGGIIQGEDYLSAGAAVGSDDARLALRKGEMQDMVPDISIHIVDRDNPPYLYSRVHFQTIDRHPDGGWHGCVGRRWADRDTREKAP